MADDTDEPARPYRIMERGDGLMFVGIASWMLATFLIFVALDDQGWSAAPPLEQIMYFLGGCVAVLVGAIFIAAGRVVRQIR